MQQMFDTAVAGPRPVGCSDDLSPDYLDKRAALLNLLGIKDGEAESEPVYMLRDLQLAHYEMPRGSSNTTNARPGG